jgi:hypothetical protein
MSKMAGYEPCPAGNLARTSTRPNFNWGILSVCRRRGCVRVCRAVAPPRVVKAAEHEVALAVVEDVLRSRRIFLLFAVYRARIRGGRGPLRRWRIDCIRPCVVARIAATTRGATCIRSRVVARAAAATRSKIFARSHVVARAAATARGKIFTRSHVAARAATTARGDIFASSHVAARAAAARLGII